MLFGAKEIQSVGDTSSPENHLQPDGFRIHFRGSEKPEIEAINAAGEFYAVNYLEDLRRQNALPKDPVILEDNPLFQERGFMLDISRDRVPTMEFLFRLIEQLAALRYNQLQLYTEHTFAFQQHQTVWKNASPITADELIQLEAHCKNNHIDLVPNQNCFGHMERWLCHSEYQHLAECPDGFEHPIAGHKDSGTTLHPSDESEALVREILGEVLPLYSSAKANIGGDEPWELGQGRSREAAKANGKHEVYLSFLQKILTIAQELGKEPIFWADIVLERPELVNRIPSGAVPAVWGYHPDHPYPEQCKIISEAGFQGKFQVVPGTNTWNSFSGRLSHAELNISRAATQGRKFGARGLILTCWGDGGHHQSTASLYPSLVLAAKACWSHPASTSLADAIDQVFYPGDHSGNGKAICEQGTIDDSLPYPNPNQSFLHRAFFADRQSLEKLLTSVSLADLKSAEQRLVGFVANSSDPSISLSRDMNLWALARCRQFLEPSEEQNDLHKSLQDLEERFQTVWFRDSRPGGFPDSAGRFPHKHL